MPKKFAAFDYEKIEKLGIVGVQSSGYYGSCMAMGKLDTNGFYVQSEKITPMRRSGLCESAFSDLFLLHSCCQQIHIAAEPKEVPQAWNIAKEILMAHGVQDMRVVTGKPGAKEVIDEEAGRYITIYPRYEKRKFPRTSDEWRNIFDEIELAFSEAKITKPKSPHLGDKYIPGSSFITYGNIGAIVPFNEPINDESLDLVEQAKKKSLNELMDGCYVACEGPDRNKKADVMARALGCKFSQSVNLCENMHLVGTFYRSLNELAALPLGRSADRLIGQIIDERKLLNEQQVLGAFDHLDKSKRDVIIKHLNAHLDVYRKSAEITIFGVAKSFFSFNGTFLNTIRMWWNKGQYVAQELQDKLNSLITRAKFANLPKVESGTRKMMSIMGVNASKAEGKEAVDASSLSELDVPPRPAPLPPSGQRTGGAKELEVPAPCYEAPSPPPEEFEAPDYYAPSLPGSLST